MQTAIVGRPPGPRNVTQVARPATQHNPPTEGDRAQDGPTAREIFSNWSVTIPRPAVMAFNNPQDFPALLVWAAARALWDRGLRGRAPGGWENWVGMSRRSWYTAKRRAIELALVKAVGSAGIKPLVKHEPGQGQYSRVPTSLLFDEKLSRTARRIFIAQALFSSGLGDSRAAVATIARASSTNPRNVHRALRELENQCRITRMGAVGRGIERYNLVGQVIHRSPKSDNPKGGKWATRATPTGESGQREPPQSGQREPPFQESIKSKELQERGEAPVPVNRPAPRDERPPPITKQQAETIVTQFGLKKFCKQSSGLQGQQASDRARKFFADWSSERLKAAIQSAEASLPDATATEQRTLRAQIKEFSDQIKKPGDFCPADFGLEFA